MADLGSIGKNEGDEFGILTISVPAFVGYDAKSEWGSGTRLDDTPLFFDTTKLYRIMLDTQPVEMTFGAIRDNSNGWGGPPCLSMSRKGIFRVRMPVKAGSRQIYVGVKQDNPVSPRPILRIKKNTLVGIAVDQEATAAISSQWTQVGPISFTASADGVLDIELEVTAGLFGNCLWDDITLT